jgi:hypothetical protein
LRDRPARRVRRQPGACAVGTVRCQAAALACVPNVEPSPELCGTGIDEDCNGPTDEPGCIDCLPADSVSATTQTRKTPVKLSSRRAVIARKHRAASECQREWCSTPTRNP